MTIAYSFQMLMTERVVIERAKRSYDGGGAETAPVWGPHATVPCRLWWDRSSGVRSANREFVSPQRVADLSAGGLIIPLGTDVTRLDRITEIQSLDPISGDFVPYISGNIEISAVLTAEDHMELDIMRLNPDG